MNRMKVRKMKQFYDIIEEYVKEEKRKAEESEAKMRANKPSRAIRSPRMR